MHPGYYWLIMTVLLLIMEMLTPGTFFMAALAMGTLAGGIVAFVVPATAWAPWLAFVVVAPITVAACRKVVTHLDKAPSPRFNADALVGQQAVVIQPIDATGSSGRVRVDSQEWRAVADRDIPAGETVKVKEIQGTRLWVG